MDLQELEITIDSEGKVNIKVAGAKGNQCLELTKPLEEALGQVETREYSAEFYQNTGETQARQTNDRK